MTFDDIRKQIESFLGSDRPEVMAIKGGWGVGKTYVWNQLLNEAKGREAIKLPNYSYVSLFGVNSLDSLKYAIFEERRSVESIGKAFTLEMAKSNFRDLDWFEAKGVLKYLQAFKSVKSVAPLLQSYAFKSVTRTVVCIDDFERISNRMELRDVLGVVLALKEQQNCKVVLIFNDEEIPEKEAEDYRRFREKVIDFELKFEPTPEECVGIALAGTDAATVQIGENIKKLKINNIRIIKKIERIAERITPLLKDYHPGVLDHALHTLCLYSLCFYRHDEGVPSCEYVKTSFANHYLRHVQADSRDEKQRKWDEFLDHYQFRDFDDLDARVADAVEKGFVDETLLNDEARCRHEQLEAETSRDTLKQAWSLYDDCFADNEQEIIDALRDSVVTHALHIRPHPLNEVVVFLRNFNRAELADEIVTLYLEARQNDPSVFDIEHHPNIDDFDPELKRRFAERHQASSDRRTLEDILREMADKDSFNLKDERRLSGFGVEEYQAFLKRQKGEGLDRFIRLCLWYRQVGNASDQQRSIARNMTAALARIARESRLNAARAGKFGIRIDGEEAASDRAGA